MPRDWVYPHKFAGDNKLRYDRKKGQSPEDLDRLVKFRISQDPPLSSLPNLHQTVLASLPDDFVSKDYVYEKQKGANVCDLIVGESAIKVSTFLPSGDISTST